MKQIARLLIAYDGSPCSDAALEDLKRAGLPKQLEAVVLTVADLVFVPPNEQLTADEIVSPGAAVMVAGLQHHVHEVLKQTQETAERGADHVKREFPEWTVSSRAEGDAPAWSVIKTAASLTADLIVVGAHRHSSVGGRLIMGSVSQRVLYEAGCSVRVARCSKQQHEGPVRVVVGFDGSTESVAAIDAVIARAWPAGSEVRVVTAGNAVAFAEQQEKLRAAGLSDSEVIRQGDPARVIIHEAEEWGADSIFLGTRNLHGLQHLLRGSVASEVAAEAQCSVEVVRQVAPR